MPLEETSGIETSPAPRFHVWAHMFLSNADPTLYYLQFTSHQGDSAAQVRARRQERSTINFLKKRKEKKGAVGVFE